MRERNQGKYSYLEVSSVICKNKEIVLFLQKSQSPINL